MSLKHRSSDPEIMDVRSLEPDEIDSTYRFLAAINRIGSARAIRSDLRRLARSWSGPVRILDVASGGADVPRAIARWAAAAGFRVSIVCVDRSADATAYARRESAAYPSIAFVRGDARALPFAPRSFDYVICSLFLHHLTDDDVVAALRAFDALARRGVVICDLIRRRRAVAWARFLSLFGNAIVRYDGPLSVKRAFTLKEIQRLAGLAGVAWARIRPVLGHHFLLSGERDPVVLQSPR